MNIPEVFLKRVDGAWQMWVESHGVETPAGPRLIKGTTRSFPNYPPEFDWTYTDNQKAFADCERLQIYLREWNTQ